MAVVASLNIVLKADVSNVLRNTSAGRKAFKQYGDDMKRLGRDITADLMTPMERLAQQEKQLQQLMQQGYISHQTYCRGLRQVRSELDQVSRSASKAGSAMNGAGGGGGGFNLLTGQSGGLGKFAKQKLLGGGFMKGGLAGFALSATMPNVMGAIQDRVESGMNTIVGFLTGTNGVEQTLQKISFGWSGYAKALEQHNVNVTKLQMQQQKADQAMVNIVKSERAFDRTLSSTLNPNSASPEVRQGQLLIAQLENERAASVARRKSIHAGGSAAFEDPLNGVDSNAAIDLQANALRNEERLQAALTRRIALTRQQVEAIEQRQSFNSASGLRAEAEGRLGAFGKTDSQLRLEELEKRQAAILAQTRGNANSALGDRLGFKEIEAAIAAEKKLMALEQERQKQDQLKKIEEDRQKLLAKQVEERKQIAEQMQREKEALAAGIVNDGKTPYERFMDRIKEINSAGLNDQQNTLAKFKATQDLAGQLGLGGNRSAGAIEFGSRESFTAMHSNPLVLTQKEVLAIAQQQLIAQNKLVDHFLNTGEITVSIP